jgi:hypothetical protein
MAGQGKDLTVADMQDVVAKVPDIEVIGDPGAWAVVGKASSKAQGWMKSTKKMLLPQGVIYQMETQQRNPDGSWALSQSAVFVPKG